MSSFAPLLRIARAWLDEPDATKLDALIARGRDATAEVPEERRADWDRLLASLSRREDEARTRAFVESLGRACRMFSTRKRAAPARAARPLDAFDAVDRLPGLGPSSRAALAEHGIHRVVDLVWTPPVGWDDLREPTPLGEAVAAARQAAEAAPGARPARVCVQAIVKSAGVVPIRGRRCVRVVLADPADPKCTLHAFWFFLAHGVLALAQPGAPVLAVGRVRVEAGKPPRAAHPELYPDTDQTRSVRARYAKLGPAPANVRKAVAHAIERGLTPDPVPPGVGAREGMPPADAVLREVHGATGAPPGEGARRAFLERLAWAEAFTRVWERLAADRADGAPAPSLPVRDDLTGALERELGFAFTPDQRAAIATISSDLAERRPMRRLLLGDVGTGKTAVALAAAAQCVAAGHAVAILAPTGVLAEQYLRALVPLERATGARVAFLAAGLPAAARREAEAALRSGAARVAVGTHALLGEAISIPGLALVVVDEQQRLGVAQRLALVRKGERPHLLTLSATPIPRTLALAIRGDLATSVLRERPAGRPPVRTELAGASSLEDVVARARATCARGERVFWVVPRIDTDDEDEDADPLASATARAEALTEALAPHRVGLLHGAMPPAARRAAMAAFRSGETALLVGTTVVEVGVDVPEATLMVVEEAERFGLAQLHQLRGRVGRGARPGSCVLVHGEPLEGVAKRRLAALTELATGEEIARTDLELRGAGDLGGTRQHGAEEELLYLEPGASYPWLARIEEDARAIRAADPELSRAEHRALGSLVERLGHVIAVREEAG